MSGRGCAILLLLLASGCGVPQAQQTGAVPSTTNRTQPGETVRVVRFTVQPQRRAEFEAFFWNSLKPAAEHTAQNQHDPVGSFRLLIPKAPRQDGFYTYYIIIDPVVGDSASGEAMRDMVRAAFPGDEGERRVQRWMSSLVLGEDAPVGEDFIEADLRTDAPPSR